MRCPCSLNAPSGTTVRPRTPPQSLLTCSPPPHYPMHAQVEMSTVLLWRVDLPHTRGAQACALRARASNAPSRASARLRKPRPSVCSCLGPIMPCRPGPTIHTYTISPALFPGAGPLRHDYGRDVWGGGGLSERLGGHRRVTFWPMHAHYSMAWCRATDAVFAVRFLCNASLYAR